MVNNEYCPLDDMVKFQELPSGSLGGAQKVCSGSLRVMCVCVCVYIYIYIYIYIYMNYYPIAGYKITYSVATLSYDNCYTNLRDYSNLVCPCEVYLLKLENFEILCCCVLVSS
jgi:hypothetical protein